MCVVHYIIKDAKPLLASELRSRRLPFDFWSSRDNWDQYLALWLYSTDTMVAMLQSEGIKLDAGRTTQLVTAVTYALEKMDDKINNHHGVDGARMRDGGRGRQSRRSLRR